MLLGVLFALAAGLMWGLVFIGPTLLADYPAALLSFGRYLAFGLIALPLAWLDRTALRQLTRADWLEAVKLSLVGNIVYYLFLSAAIQRAGGPLPTMIIGTLPVVIAIASNLRDSARDGRLPWRRLAPSLGLIGLGIALVNRVELAHLRADPQADLARYASGAALAIVAVACWTWYPIRNADWLRRHIAPRSDTPRTTSAPAEASSTASQHLADATPHHGDEPAKIGSPSTWATAQGLATLPLALVGYAGTVAVLGLTGSDLPLPLGPRPLQFVALMAAIGLFASWLGTLCWNEASQRLPTTLVGQLIVFETLSALAYAYALRGQWPELGTLTGIALLMAGVWWALRIKPVATA